MTLQRDRFILFVLCLYGLGTTLSQSLLSMGGTLCSVAGAYYAYQALSQKTRFAKLSWATLLYMSFLLAGVICRPSDRTFTRSFELIPLYLVPLGIMGLLDSLQPLAKLRLIHILDNFLNMGIAVVSGLAFYQNFIAGVPATGFFNNPIYFAYALFPIFLYRLWSLTDASQKTTLNKISLGILFLCIIASQNRMIPMASVLALGYFYFRKLKNKPSRAEIASWIGIALIFFVASYYASPALREKLSRPIGTQDLSVLWRWKAWQYNWQLFTESPIFGVGFLKNGIDTNIQTHLAGHWKPGVLIYAHSIYLQILAEGGLLGISLLGFWLFQLGRLSTGIAYLVIFNFLIAGVTENITVNSKPFHSMLFFMGLLSVYQKYSETNRQR